MVLVFSQNANVSSQIKREVERAVDKEVYTIPLRIDDVKPTRSLEYFISTSQWVDAFSPPLERHLDKLAQTVKSILARFADTPASTHKAAAPIQQDETPMQARDTGKSSLVWVKPAIVLAALMFAGVTMWYFLGQKNEREIGRAH